MRYTLFFSALIWSSLLSAQPSHHEVTISSGRFILQGTTNLNTFECTLSQALPCKPIVVKTTSEARQIRFEGLELKYPVSEFDCGLEAMSQDLRKTLKSDAYPYLLLRINDIQIKNESQEVAKLTVVSSVTITLAGKSHDALVENGLVINHSEGALTLAGTQHLSMHDFDLEAPTKFFGMVKVNDELNVSFELRMEVKSLD
ncbi:hypothetical protein [Marinoscillum sp. 108]|uniref:hypothetical protein n=1 Tax=Marinoscillum sp. 108 TaxID=2653151 RepID=UPI0012F131E0|nr:hypothetical protein [Marinoscillum sp. 108]VXD12918.1 conserved exported hypothetical protein [Marinoscillum sp. 108]